MHFNSRKRNKFVTYGELAGILCGCCNVFFSGTETPSCEDGRVGDHFFDVNERILYKKNPDDCIWDEVFRLDVIPGGGLLTAANGLYISGGTEVRLGGSLIEPTFVNISGYPLVFFTKALSTEIFQEYDGTGSGSGIETLVTRGAFESAFLLPGPSIVSDIRPIHLYQEGSRDSKAGLELAGGDINPKGHGAAIYYEYNLTDPLPTGYRAEANSSGIVFSFTHNLPTGLGYYIFPDIRGTQNQVLTSQGSIDEQLIWEDVSNLISIPVTGADNGVNITTNPGVVELGGTLIRDTDINLGGTGAGDPQYRLRLRAFRPPIQTTYLFEEDQAIFNVFQAIPPTLVEGSDFILTLPSNGTSGFSQQAKLPSVGKSAVIADFQDSNSRAITTLESSYDGDVTELSVHSDTGVHVLQSSAGGEYILPLTNGNPLQVLVTPGGDPAQLYWEDLSTLIGGSPGPIVIAENGLHPKVGDPSTIHLGGLLIEDTLISGSSAFEVDVKNNLNLTGDTTSLNSALGNLYIDASGGILEITAPNTLELIINGTPGNNGEVLTSNGTQAYWAPPDGGINLLSISFNTSVANDTDLVICDCTTGPITVFLLSTTIAERKVAIKKIDSTPNAVTVTPIGGDTIDNASTYNITTQYNSITAFPDPATNNYWII